MKRLALVMFAILMALPTAAFAATCGTACWQSVSPGKTLADADVTKGTGALEQILGDTESIAMFKIKAAGTTLTAWEMDGSVAFQLFLFDSTGAGVKASAQGPGGTDVLTGEPSGVALVAPVTAGADYYLAIAANFWEPFTTGDLLMFTTLVGGDPVGTGLLKGWTDGFFSDPPFTIALLDALPSAEPDTRVPEPGTLLLIGTGLVGLGVAARRRRRS